MFRQLPGLICKPIVLRACTEQLNVDVVAISSPGISIPLLNQSFKLVENALKLGHVSWVKRFGPGNPTLSCAATALTLRNHLSVVVNGCSYPIYFRPGSVGSGDLNQCAKHFHFFHSEGCKHRTWSGWSPGPDTT